MRYISITCCVLGLGGIGPIEGRAEDWCVTAYPWEASAADSFGRSLSLSDSWLAVGDVARFNTGAVLLYPRSGERLGDAIVLRAPVPTPGALFGATVGDRRLERNSAELVEGWVAKPEAAVEVRAGRRAGRVLA